MGYKTKKCKLCGYRFKKHDGGICPECFTSREETLDCADLSSDLHSHGVGFDMDTIFSGSSDDFDVKKELEKEKKEHAEFQAEYSKRKEKFNEKVQKATGSKGYRTTYTHQRSTPGNSGVSGTTTTTTTGYTSTNGRLTEEQKKKLEAYYASRGNTTPTATQSGEYSFGGPLMRNTQKKKIGVFPIVFVIFLILIPVVNIVPQFLNSVEINPDYEDNNDYEYSVDITDDYEAPTEYFFGAALNFDVMKYAISEPVIESYHASQSFANFENYIDDGNDLGYDGDYSLISVNATFENYSGDVVSFIPSDMIKAYYYGLGADGYTKLVECRCIAVRYDGVFYEPGDSASDVTFLDSYETKSFKLYFAIPYTQEIIGDENYEYLLDGDFYIEVWVEDSLNTFNYHQLSFNPQELALAQSFGELDNEEQSE